MMIQIPNVAEETKERIKRSSAYSLPNNPTGAGYKAQDIKNTLFKPIVDGQYSVLAEIERLINELNSLLPTIKISAINLTDDERIQIIDDNGTVITEMYLPYVRWNKAVNDISLELDRDFKITAKLRSPDGEIAISNPIDLPIESLVVNATYYNGNIVLELQNGNTIAFEVTDLINGLVNEDSLNSTLSDLTVYYDNKITNECDSVYNASKDYTDDKIANLNISGDGNITVEQEVNDSDNPVSSKAVKEEFVEFSTYYDGEIENAKNEISQAVVKQEYFNDGATLDIAHNKDYHTNDNITNLLIRIPSGNILCSVMFKIIDSGDFNIEIMGVNGYVGKAPDFKNGETWELSIHNGIIASGKVVSE